MDSGHKVSRINRQIFWHLFSITFFYFFAILHLFWFLTSFYPWKIYIIIYILLNKKCDTISCDLFTDFWLNSIARAHCLICNFYLSKVYLMNKLEACYEIFFTEALLNNFKWLLTTKFRNHKVHPERFYLAMKFHVCDFRVVKNLWLYYHCYFPMIFVLSFMPREDNPHSFWNPLQW